jgi:hypothetical protein
MVPSSARGKRVRQFIRSDKLGRKLRRNGAGSVGIRPPVVLWKAISVFDRDPDWMTICRMHHEHVGPGYPAD